MPPPPPGPISGETAFWQAIENSTELADFEDYLRKCRRGEFTGNYKATAELKLARLKNAKVSAIWARISGAARKLLKYKKVEQFEEDLARVELPLYSYGFVNRSGNEVIPSKYSFSAWRSWNGLVLVALNGKYGFFKNGKAVIPLKFDKAWPFYHELAIVNLSGKWGLINIRWTGSNLVSLR